MQLTLSQAVAMATTVGAGWMMIRVATVKEALRLRAPARCASCGKRMTGRRCTCTSIE